VSSLVAGTACPSLKFKIEEWSVTLGTTTVFTGGVFADMAARQGMFANGTKSVKSLN